ncbi:MAG: type III pantothenate kinase [Candidatus Omnitrophica bacterium]|nr:type III pantothenate kinase [Candidatus Omnitrophota bacterium]MBU4303522.1 type III pantothenate kinase [Candidatus Omnitrophota bacterium]MBU4418866.1 type III pantothenate kinase [Candidatus Omnitrophota bacterium]MBU4467792.1 type III pantothenate kinase [Candidatus Omnitrophota bacterium]MCG2707178.1 type III pantothenate kinase [Candidatus Omnitrophota bacterium]
MLLAIDIGNTNISGGIFSGEKLKHQFDIATKSYKKTALAKKLKAYPGISASIICSVVPKLTRVIQRDLKLLYRRNPYIIGKDLLVPLENRYRLPQQVGQDRLVNAYAASSFYTGPLIVIDSGTAITFDVISKDRAYLGGLIFPGMNISLEALKEKTALLPQVKLEQPKMLIGRDTKNSILSGVVFGTAALSKELAARIKQYLGKNAKIIGTGGNISLIKKYSGMKIKIHKDLTLIGIKLIYENEIAKEKAGFRKNS